MRRIYKQRRSVTATSVLGLGRTSRRRRSRGVRAVTWARRRLERAVRGSLAGMRVDHARGLAGPVMKHESTSTPLPWGAFVLRGALALAFGSVALLAPGIAFLSLVYLFALFAMIEGATNLAAVFARAPATTPRGARLLAGLVGIAAGGLAIALPGLTALAFVYLVAFWAIASGVLEIATAIRLRQEIRGEWLLALAGVISIAFGVTAALFPAAGVLGIALWIGVYALVTGALLVAGGLALRRRTRGAPPRDFQPLAGGT